MKELLRQLCVCNSKQDVCEVLVIAVAGDLAVVAISEVLNDVARAYANAERYVESVSHFN